jgi:ribosomal protein S18 acetylase RimI-like enzyme
LDEQHNRSPQAILKAVSEPSQTEVVAAIEDSLVAQWSHFGLWPRGELHTEHGLTWIEAPMRHLPYNAVVRTHLDPGSADTALDTVLARYRERGVDFMWVDHPSGTPDDLGRRLTERGLEPVEVATGMSLELRDWQPTGPTPLVKEAIDDAALEAYRNLLMRYWEIPEDEQDLVTELHQYWSPSRVPGHRYLAFTSDGVPIGKGYLSLAGPPGVASIFGMSVVPEARGRGVASTITTAMLSRAKAEGCACVVLHSSEAAVGLYRRAGFAERCELKVYATNSLWSQDH